MARMHSGKKGRSGSSRPYRTSQPDWVEYDKKEVEEFVEKFAKEGLKPSGIGLRMRDQNGVPSIKLVTGKRVSTILKGKNLAGNIPEDLISLIEKAVAIDKHMKENPKDYSSKRGLQLTEAKIWRLVKYYKRTNKLPQDWKYNLETAKLLVK